ncbi:class I SAM-dependent methyltransferase, partial [Streptococcus pluranimalium]
FVQGTFLQTTVSFFGSAGMGGTRQTTSVDFAKGVVELAEALFKANGLDTLNHNLKVMDVFVYSRHAKRHVLTHDVIVIDPTSFARNKKQTFSVSKDYHRLDSEAVAMLNPKGIWSCSTNAATLSVKQVKKQVNKGVVGEGCKVMFLDKKQEEFKIKKNKILKTTNAP